MTFTRYNHIPYPRNGMTLEQESQAGGNHVANGDEKDSVDTDTDVFVGEYPQVGY